MSAFLDDPSSTFSSNTATDSTRKRVKLPKPKWHPEWTLSRVISGHTGWVRSVAVDVSNEWFATGSSDRTIKIWDLAAGTLKLTLTGHISAVRGLAISDRHPYLFSVGEDRLVKCWDLEVNKVVRHYHGHLHSVTSVAVHPLLDVLVTAGRDAVARVWDMRTKAQVLVLSGHKDEIPCLAVQDATPQVITGSMDSTLRTWDLAAGKTLSTLTYHKKSVRALAVHPVDYAFVAGSADGIRKYKCPHGSLIQDVTKAGSASPSSVPINTLSINESATGGKGGILVSGSDSGTLEFFDWRSGASFQKIHSEVQPGSLEAEAGIFASTFDRSGLRLITTEADKTIKVWKEKDEDKESNS